MIAVATPTRAYEVFSRLKQLKLETGEKFLETGALLVEVDDKKLWDEFGHPSLRSFIADPELDISSAYASMCMNVYKRFIIEYGLDPKRVIEAGWSKAYLLLGVVTSSGEADRMLQAAAGQSRSDLKKSLLQLKNGVEEHECQHVFALEKCSTCGQVRTKQ